MSTLSEVLMPIGFLVHCLNVAIASLVVSAIALVLSRCSVWSLPVRHALLVAALAVVLAAPLVMPLVPSIWSIRGSESPDQSPPAVAVQATGNIHQHEDPETPIATSIPVVETATDRLAIARSPAFPRVSAVPDRIPPAPILERRSVAAPQWTSTIATLSCGIWFVGIAVGLGRAFLGLAKLRRWMPTVSVAESPLIAAAARWAAERVGLRSAVEIYHSNLLPAPVTFGLLRPRIVVPAGIESNLSLDQLRAVILHEMAHIARRDLWVGLLQFTQILYWWNPLVRSVNRQISELREQICDDIAIRELPEPGAYAETLINLAERCSRSIPVPATIGIGSSPTSQLETRIRRIVSAPQATCLCLSRRAAVGVSAAAIFMAATVLFAQVKVESPAGQRTDDLVQNDAVKPAVKPADKVQADPSLSELIQQMAAYEKAYLPFQYKVMETFRMADGLTPQQRARYPWADGRKHQRLMEYAQLAPRVWRSKETLLINDEAPEGRLPFEQFSDGERLISPSLQDSFTADGKQTLEVRIETNKDQISTYLMAEPVYGVFCLSAYGGAERFSEAFQADEEAVELAWDKGDAKLTFVYGHPKMKARFVLWLSRSHAWHPIRLQRHLDLEDKLFHDEWEATRLVQRGKQWRVVEGTHRYRDYRETKLPDPKIIYSLDFKVLEEKFGNDVDKQQFHYQIPAGAVIRDSQKPEPEPPPPSKTREITVTVVDVAGQPIPEVSVRLRALRSHVVSSHDWDLVTTDDRGVARSAKAPQSDVLLQITAPAFRPATWIMGTGRANELRATLVPLSPGIAVDQQGKPVADAQITNETIHFRTDGMAAIPSRGLDAKDRAWSNSEGRFELTSELTVRRPDALVPYIAVGPNRDQMAIRFVPARETGQQQKLALEPVCRVHGHCLLKGMTESTQVWSNLETPRGEYIGGVESRRKLTPDGLRVDFEMQLPAGAYVLKSRQTSHQAGFEIPFTIPEGERELDLGTTAVSPAGAITLKGKPAPPLDVQWRAGQQSNWEKLRGQVVVLDFWGTWCGPCIADMPELIELHDQFRDRPVKWLSIHTPNLKSFEEFDEQTAKLQESAWNKRALPFTTVIDLPLADQEYSGKTSQHYGVAEWPTLVVVDQQGNVVGPVHKNKLAATITQLLEGINK